MSFKLIKKLHVCLLYISRCKKNIIKNDHIPLLNYGIRFPVDEQFLKIKDHRYCTFELFDKTWTCVNVEIVVKTT